MDLILGVRPEDIALSRTSEGDDWLPVEVYVVEPLGSEKIINIKVAGHILKARTSPTFPARTGETLYARIDQTRAHLFDAQTTRSLTRREG